MIHFIRGKLVILNPGSIVIENNGIGYGLTVPAYIQVVRPSLIDALNQLKAVGFQRMVIAPNYMFPGRLQNSAAQQAADWATNPGIEVRLADVIGDCDALAEVVVDRYRTGAAKALRDAAYFD